MSILIITKSDDNESIELVTKELLALGEEVIRVCGSYQVVEFMRQGVDPNVAARRVLQRILRRRGANEAHFVGFAALRADGKVGFASTLPGFQVTLSRQGRHEVLDAPSLTRKSEAAGG